MIIECPGCEQLMNRNNFARSSGVIIDVCPSHGTWLDAERDAQRAREQVRPADIAPAATSWWTQSSGPLAEAFSTDP